MKSVLVVVIVSWIVMCLFGALGVNEDTDVRISFVVALVLGLTALVSVYFAFGG